jgi:peptidoglycan/LPS O-acetylase OafA/YrhL
MSAVIPTLRSHVRDSAMSASRIPSLDGLRAVAIVVTVFGHLIGTAGFPIRHSPEIGLFGVQFFFVISGFLITGLLLNEQRSTGTISLGRFYLRRTFRIFPPYYAFLLALAAMSAAGWITLRTGDMLHAVTYTENYHREHSWYVGHAWSLSVEEQFYLLWPAALLLAGTSRGLWGAGVFVMLAPLIRVAEWLLVPAWRDHIIGHSFETVADAIAIGCVLAGIRGWLWERRAYRAVLESKCFVVIPVLAFAMYLIDQPRFRLTVGMTTMNVCIALCVDWCLRFPGDRVGRFLNWRPVVYVGTLSYSIYLWQQLFLNRYSQAAVNAFPLNLVMVAVFALLSYYGVERPWLNRRQRIEERFFGRDSHARSIPASAAGVSSLMAGQPAASSPSARLNEPLPMS